MDNFLSSFYAYLIETIVLFLGLVFIWISKKASDYLEKLKQKDTLNIIDHLTDRAVEFVEKEFEGKSGQDKKQEALITAKKFLSERGIKLSDDELSSGIENGVNKLKELRKNKRG